MQARAALGPVRTRVDIARQEEPSATGASLMAGVGWVWRGAFAELDATLERAAVVDGDSDLPVDSFSQLGLGGAFGVRAPFGLDAAATLGRTRIWLHYEDEAWDFERDGWLFGLRAAKTWRVGESPWSLGFELGAELAYLDKNPLEFQRPLVWTYRLRAVALRW